MVNATAKMDKFWKQTKFDESIQKFDYYMCLNVCILQYHRVD